MRLFLGKSVEKPWKSHPHPSYSKVPDVCHVFTHVLVPIKEIIAGFPLQYIVLFYPMVIHIFSLDFW